MKSQESLFPDDWYRVSDRDLKRARLLLSANDLEGTGFNIQQAVEKRLKGFLLSTGWQLRRIHDLEPLLNEAIESDPAFESFRVACLKMNRYYVHERYPSSKPCGYTLEEMKQSLGAAEGLIALIDRLRAH